MLQEIFDKVYEGIKNVLLPKPKAPLPPSPVAASAPVILKTTEAPVVLTATQAAPIASVVLPVKKAETPTNVSLARGTLTLEQQKELLEQRKKIPLWIMFLKYVSLILAVGGFVAFVWIKVDMDSMNSYLKYVGVRENTGMKFENLNRKIDTLTQENGEFMSRIRRFSQQIEEKNYSIYTVTIEKIKSGQLDWFDKKNPDGTILKYGLLDSPNHMEEYFNSKSFDDPILFGSGNSVEVSDVTADTNSVDFGVKSVHLFGKVFSLDTEFVKMMNSFPIFKNGELNQFSKKKDEDGNDVMDFSLKLDIQSPDEVDADDQYFSKYENWFKNSLPSQ